MNSHQHSYILCILTGPSDPNSLSNSLAMSRANLVSPTDCRLQMMDTTTPWGGGLFLTAVG